MLGTPSLTRNHFRFLSRTEFGFTLVASFAPSLKCISLWAIKVTLSGFFSSLNFTLSSGRDNRYIGAKIFTLKLSVWKIYILNCYTHFNYGYFSNKFVTSGSSEFWFLSLLNVQGACLHNITRIHNSVFVSAMSRVKAITIIFQS